LSCNPSTFEINEASNIPKLETQLLDVNDQPIDLTLSTSVLFWVYDLDSKRAIVSGADIEDGDAQGNLTFQFSVAQTEVPGTYTGLIKETHPGSPPPKEETTEHYITVTVRDAAVGDVLAGTDHGALTHLTDDDHQQYLSTQRHDAMARHVLGVSVPQELSGLLPQLP